MCNTCVADEVLKAGMEGCRFAMANGATPIEGIPAVIVRARKCRGSEFCRGEWQIRRQGTRWPRTWNQTLDLAGTMGKIGLELKWRYMPKSMRDWVKNGGRFPNELK